MNTIDTPKAILGVPGTLIARSTPGASTWSVQKWTSERRTLKGHGPGVTIRAEIRFDDSCRNGHNSFGMTAEILQHGREYMGGCCHDEIVQAFPELAGLIKWHLTSSDGPMHYIANTVYHASNRDHHGKLAGEPWAWADAVQFGENPIKHKIESKFAAFLIEFAEGHARKPYDFEVLQYDHKDRKTYGSKYTFGGFGTAWHECPFNSEAQALDFLTALQTCSPKFLRIPTLWSEGKPRDLAAARSCAIWPEATDEQLMADKDELTAALQARHPALMAAFRADLEAAGIIWAPEA